MLVVQAPALKVRLCHVPTLTNLNKVQQQQQQQQPAPRHRSTGILSVMDDLEDVLSALIYGVTLVQTARLEVNTDMVHARAEDFCPPDDRSFLQASVLLPNLGDVAAVS